MAASPRTSVPGSDTQDNPRQDSHTAAKPAIGKRKRESLDGFRMEITSSMPLPSNNAAVESYKEAALSPSVEACTQHLGVDCEGLLQNPLHRPAKSLIDFDLDDSTEFLRVAQLIADQMVLHSHDLLASLDSAGSSGTTEMSDLSRCRDQFIDAAILTAVKGIKRCSLKELTTAATEASDSERGGAGSSFDLAAVQSNAPKLLDTVFKPESPLISIRREGVPLDLNSSALNFWEELGLGALSGPKDVDAICLCPQLPNLKQRLVGLLEGIGSAYQGCKFGLYKPWTQAGDRHGVYPLDFDLKKGLKYVRQAMNDVCQLLGMSLHFSRCLSETDELQAGPCLNQGPRGGLL